MVNGVPIVFVRLGFAPLTLSGVEREGYGVERVLTRPFQVSQ